MMSSQILWQFKKGDKIAQLLLFPYISINSSNDIKIGRFNSTDQKQSLWTSLVSEYAQPNINIKINGKRFSGLLDTGSDITIISKHSWPKSWPVQKISWQIAGISQTKVQEVYQSTQIYPCEEPEGQPATLRPYVTDAPLNLIGRDVLMQWQTHIHIPHFSLNLNAYRSDTAVSLKYTVSLNWFNGLCGSHYYFLLGWLHRWLWSLILRVQLYLPFHIFWGQKNGLIYFLKILIYIQIKRVLSAQLSVNSKNLLQNHTQLKIY